MHTILLLVYWSAPNGQHSIGTPVQTLSSLEFHPQCIRNALTALCQSTASCRHQLVTRPCPSVSARNSGGRTTVVAPVAPVACWSLLITHRNS